MISSIDPAPSVISCGGQSALFLSACPQGFQEIFQQGAKGPKKIVALLRQPATPSAWFGTPRDPLPASPHNQLHCVAYGLTECRSSGLTADSSILVQPHRQKFLEGRGAGRENLFPKRFPSPQAFLSSNLQASPKQKIPGGAGTKKDPLALRAARGSRTIFGSGLLSHMTLCSIIGDGELNFRVRNGVGCTLSSMATKEIWQIY